MEQTEEIVEGTLGESFATGSIFDRRLEHATMSLNERMPKGEALCLLCLGTEELTATLDVGN